MTYTIPEGALKRIHSEAFGAELRKAMTARKVGSRWLAAQLGLGRTTICHYLEGDVLPRIAQAEVLASALARPKLLTLVREARTSACEICGKSFLNDGGGPKRFCSPSCRAVQAKRRAGVPVAHRADRAEQERDVALLQVGEYMLAVEAMCRSCEPGGVCQVDDCALRPVSPLPLADDDEAPIPRLQPPPGAWGSEVNRTTMLKAVRAANAKRWTPEERERWRQKMIARHAKARAEASA